MNTFLPRFHFLMVEHSVAGLLAAAFALAAPDPVHAQVTATVTDLYSIPGSDYNYQAPLVQGRDGNFYGTTPDSGANGKGIVFRITPAGESTTIYNFHTSGAYVHLYNGIIACSDGSFYETTDKGGDDNRGTIFRLTVSAVHPAFFAGEAALGSGVYYLRSPTAIRSVTIASSLTSATSTTSISGTSTSLTRTMATRPCTSTTLPAARSSTRRLPSRSRTCTIFVRHGALLLP